jgi:hypothetical protein
MNLRKRIAWPVVRALGMAIDWPLRLRPSLCSDLYLIGKK